MMAGHSTARKLFIAALIISAASLVFTPPSAVRAVLGFLQAYYLPGVVFLAFLGDRQRPRLDSLFIPLLISPVILSLLTLGLYGLTGTLPAAIRASLLVLYALLLAALFTGRLRDNEKPSTVPYAILPVCLILCGAVTVSYILNGYLLVYTDAWYHASVAYEILDRGLPPLDPRFPDIPLRYMWFYHMFQAVFKELSGLSIFRVLGIFNIVTAFVFPYLIARLTSIFTWKRRYVLSTPVLAIAGLQAAPWILWPLFLVRALFGEVRGWEEIARNIKGIELNGARVIYFLTPPWTWLMSMMDKFLTITAFNYSLNLFLLCFIISIGYNFQDKPGMRVSINIFLIMIGTLLFHAVTGMALILTAIGTGVLIAVIQRIKYAKKPPVFHSLAVPASAALAGIVGMPYFISLTGGGGGENFILDHLHLGVKNLVTIIAPIVVLVPFSLAALKKIFTSGREDFRILAIWISVLFILSLFTDLPGIAENKLIFPLFLLLLLPVARQIIDRITSSVGARRIMLCIWMIVLFLVPPVLTVRGFILEKPKTANFAKRYRISDEERRLFDWIRNTTPADAVIIEKNTYNLMPVHARRRNFYLNPIFIYVHDYGGEKVERYGRIQRELFSDEPIAPETIDSLRSVGMNFYVVVWEEDLIDDPGLNGNFQSRPEWFTKVFENNAGKIYHLENR